MDSPGQLTRFGALRVPAYRQYFSFTLLSMTADNIEHVISYWVMFQTFRSPALAGFAVISHWLPFLLFSLHAGALADRYDCRRLIQISQGLFMAASAAWGLLFLTGTLEMWHAVVLLLVHGFAGVLNAPALQLMIHDMVPAQHLPSAIRLNASSRQLAILLGPAVGGGLMLLFGPAWGLLVNVLIYFPLTILLIRIPYNGHAELGPARVSRRIGFIEGVDAVAAARTDPRIMTMIVLAGVTSFFVGNAFQAQMPEYALALGADPDGTWYSILLAANAAGAIVGVILLETSHLLRPSARSAIVCAVVWGITMGLFPVARSYGLAISLLVVAGMFNIAFTSMAQTVVQVLAPAAVRGRIVGLFNTSLLGLRAGGGLTVGILGALIGVRLSLVLSSAVVVVMCGALFLWEARAEQRLTDELAADRLARVSK
ncbi:MAG: MFS transporter [Acidimicrobiia bacterium]|nr:MFS transporter [Acidimicrobiia bacterium]